MFINEKIIPDIPDDVLAAYPKVVILRYYKKDDSDNILEEAYYMLASTDAFAYLAAGVAEGIDTNVLGSPGSLQGYLMVNAAEWELQGETETGNTPISIGATTDASSVTTTLVPIWANHDIYNLTAYDTTTGEYTVGDICFNKRVEVCGYWLPQIPDSVNEYPYTFILRMGGGSSAAQFTIVSASQRPVHVSNKLIVDAALGSSEEETDESEMALLYTLGIDLLTCQNGSYIEKSYTEETGTWTDVESDSDFNAWPTGNLFGVAISQIICSNCDIKSASSIDEDGNVVEGDFCYHTSSVYSGEKEYAVPGKWVWEIANATRAMEAMGKHTTDTILKKIGDRGFGYMEKIAGSLSKTSAGGGPLSALLLFLAMMQGVTSYTKNFDIFPFQLFMLTTKVELPFATEIGMGAFATNPALTDIYAPNLQKIGGYAFVGNNMETTNFPLVKEIGDLAFNGADKLVSAPFPNIEKIGAGAFLGCTALTSFVIPKSTVFMGNDILGDSNPFSGCTALATVTIDPLNEHYCVEDGRTVYTKDKAVLISPPCGVASFTIPDGVMRIASSAFSGDTVLADIVFPATLEKVGTSAFEDCTALTKAVLPESCTELGDSAFNSCTALAALVLPKSDAIVTIGSSCLSDTAISSGTGYIYVPSALFETYKADSGWSDYANQFKSIEEYVG